MPHAGLRGRSLQQSGHGFAPRAELLAAASYATLYRRGVGRLRSALDLPVVDEAGGREKRGAAPARPRRGLANAAD